MKTFKAALTGRFFFAISEHPCLLVDDLHKTLTDFYTMRESNGAKITHPKESLPGSDNYYTVLTDTYQKQMEGKTETFWFKGFVNDSLVINEPFVISADQCHISYVSGKTEVQL